MGLVLGGGGVVFFFLCSGGGGGAGLPRCIECHGGLVGAEGLLLLPRQQLLQGKLGLVPATGMGVVGVGQRRCHTTIETYPSIPTRGGRPGTTSHVDLRGSCTASHAAKNTRFVLYSQARRTHAPPSGPWGDDLTRSQITRDKRSKIIMVQQDVLSVVWHGRDGPLQHGASLLQNCPLAAGESRGQAAHGVVAAGGAAEQTGREDGQRRLIKHNGHNSWAVEPK